MDLATVAFFDECFERAIFVMNQFTRRSKFDLCAVLVSYRLDNPRWIYLLYDLRLEPSGDKLVSDLNEAIYL